MQLRYSEQKLPLFLSVFILHAYGSDAPHFLLFGAVSVFHKHTSTRATTFPF